MGELDFMATRNASLFFAMLMIGGFALTACGPKPEPARPRARAGDAPPPGDDRPAPRKDEDVQISGLMGQIDASAVEKAFENHMNQVRACRRDNLGSFKYVGGTVQFFFVIGMDGVPTKVVLEKSQLGRYPLEACLIKVAKSLKFVKPKGGKAEVRYSMELAADGAEAKDRDASWVHKTMRRVKGAILACRQGMRPSKFSVTFYVLPQGKAQTAGVASTEDIPDGFGACVTKVITRTTWPDPLGEVARVTVDF